MALKYRDIKPVAEGQLINAGVWGMFPVPLERVTQSIGYELIFVDADPDISGAIKYAAKQIIVNAKHHVLRQRFTISHEIGHAVLHSVEGVDKVDFRRDMESLGLDSNDGTKQKEVEANYFAANLLMPEEEFIRIWRLRQGNVNSLARYFGVSTEAVAIRLKTLKLPTPVLV